MNQNDTVASFIRTTRYVIAETKADPKTEDLAHLVSDPQAHLFTGTSKRNTAEDALIEAEAKRDYHLRVLQQEFVPLGLKIAAHFGTRGAEGYQRIFVESPSAYSALPIKDQAKKYAAFIASLESPLTPKELAPLVKKMKSLHEPWVAGNKVVDQLKQPLKDAEEGVDKAKEDILIGLARLRAQVADRYPRQPRVVASFFPAPRKKAKKKEETPG